MPTSAYVPVEPESGKKCRSIPPIAPPSIAPTNRVGANIPPGAPLTNESVVARIFSPASAASIFHVNWSCMA